ncbi:unnamed protein product [Linum trigynum]|uniref:Uncharacterized protein n=1 Tax=Linum trigynum TaxID=586398 RepID=A0AAV2FLQ9_9ROSI
MRSPSRDTFQLCPCDRAHAQVIDGGLYAPAKMVSQEPANCCIGIACFGGEGAIRLNLDLAFLRRCPNELNSCSLNLFVNVYLAEALMCLAINAKPSFKLVYQIKFRVHLAIQGVFVPLFLKQPTDDPKINFVVPNFKVR